MSGVFTPLGKLVRDNPEEAREEIRRLLYLSGGCVRQARIRAGVTHTSFYRAMKTLNMLHEADDIYRWNEQRFRIPKYEELQSAAS